MKRTSFALMTSAVCALLAACEQPVSTWPPKNTVPAPKPYYVKHPVNVVCPSCNGSGLYVDPYGNASGDPICPRCKGEGGYVVYED